MLNIFYKNYYMETLMKPSVFVLAAVLACTNIHAQSADDIVNKYVVAIGGKSAVENVKTLYIESDVDFQGNPVPSTTWIISGKGYKSELEFGGAKMQQCITDKGGWMTTPGSTTAQAMPEEQMKTMKGQINVGGPLYDYASKGNKIELIGQDTGDYKVKLTTPSAVSVTFFINKKTYLIDKTVSNANIQGQDMETTVTFSDYRKLDGGYLMNFYQEVTLPMYNLKITHKKVEVNKPIDPSIFEIPK